MKYRIGRCFARSAFTEISKHSLLPLPRSAYSLKACPPISVPSVIRSSVSQPPYRSSTFSVFFSAVTFTGTSSREALTSALGASQPVIR